MAIYLKLIAKFAVEVWRLRLDAETKPQPNTLLKRPNPSGEGPGRASQEVLPVSFYESDAEMRKQRTVVYVDGFNLYYCALKKTQYKWLNLEKLCDNALIPAAHDVCKIKFFSARISARPDDPNAPTRQDVYWRALKSFCPKVEIIEGFFLSSEKFSFLAPCAGKGYVKTIKTEEKGSDVNLAVHMLNDAWKNEYDCAVLLSNDSDMYESTSLVKNDCGKRIGWLYPEGRDIHLSKKLMGIVDFKRKITNSILAASQLPAIIPGANIAKPSVW